MVQHTGTPYKIATLNQAPQMPVFRIEPISMVGNSLLVWDDPRKSGITCRSIQMETYIAEFIVKACNKHSQLVEALQNSLQLCEKVIELAEHGDYSNGNTDGVIDEGSVLALRHLTELKKEYAVLKEDGK